MAHEFAKGFFFSNQLRSFPEATTAIRNAMPKSPISERYHDEMARMSGLHIWGAVKWLTVAEIGKYLVVPQAHISKEFLLIAAIPALAHASIGLSGLLWNAHIEDVQRNHNRL